MSNTVRNYGNESKQYLQDFLDTKRLFIALWPSAAVQSELANLLAPPSEPRGVSVVTSNLHMTLVFLGNSSMAREACYRGALAKLKYAPIALEINRLGFWREPRILWAAPEETPVALTQLVEEINALLRPCGFTPEPRPFRAHVTLKRQCSDAAPERSLRLPVHWLADTVALVWSQSTAQGVRYQPILQVPATKTRPA